MKFVASLWPARFEDLSTFYGSASFTLAAKLKFEKKLWREEKRKSLDHCMNHVNQNASYILMPLGQGVL